MSDSQVSSPFCPWCFVSANSEKITNLNPNKFVTRVSAVSTVHKTSTGPFDREGWMCILCLIKLPKDAWAQAMEWAALFCGCDEEDISEFITKAV